MKSNSSQNNLILAHLQSGKSLTSLEAMTLFGCMRLGSRIHDLREAGHQIDTTNYHDEKIDKRYAKYTIIVKATA